MSTQSAPHIATLILFCTRAGTVRPANPSIGSPDNFIRMAGYFLRLLLRTSGPQLREGCARRIELSGGETFQQTHTNAEQLTLFDFNTGFQ